MYFYFQPNLNKSIDHENEVLLQEARTISVSLISQGVPNDWNADNVERIGLSDEDKSINISKLARFYNLSYAKGKEKFKVLNDYYVFLKDDEGNLVNIYIGPEYKNATGYYNESITKKVTKISRIVAFNHTLVELMVYTWK